MDSVVPRGRLYSSPPPLRTASDDKPTLLVSWWCTLFALMVILFRLAGRYVRTEQLFREDKVMAISIIPLFARIGLIHVVLHWGTNNTITDGLGPLEIHQKEIGSRLVLASRIMFAATLWAQKFSITEFFKRITFQFWRRSYQLGLQFLRWFLVLTFLCIIISSLTECRPFVHYWQVVPDPGARCRQGYAQLVTTATVDVITDLLLVAVPIPVILRSQFTAKRKFQLVILFSLSLIPAAVTIYRVPSIIDRHGRQQFRTLWASIEILFSTGISNALVLGSFVRDRGPKKLKFRLGETGDSMSRPSTKRRFSTRERHGWGSDEDLVRGLGMNLDPELRAMNEMRLKPRPAPVAAPARAMGSRKGHHHLHHGHHHGHGHRPPPLETHNSNNNKYPYPPPSSGSSDPDSPLSFRTPDTAAESPGEDSLFSPMGVSFFDVGGLLEDGTARISVSAATAQERPTMPPQSHSQPHGHGHSRRHHFAHAHDFGAPHAHGSSSRLLEDIGGLFTSPSHRSRGGDSHGHGHGLGRRSSRTHSQSYVPVPAITSSHLPEPHAYPYPPPPPPPSTAGGPQVHMQALPPPVHRPQFPREQSSRSRNTQGRGNGSGSRVAQREPPGRTRKRSTSGTGGGGESLDIVKVESLKDPGGLLKQ